MFDFTGKVLNIHKVDDDIYRAEGLYQPEGRPIVYGGHIYTLGAYAATETVPSEFDLHNLHVYFLKAVKPNSPVDFHVERLRDGSMISTRAVLGKQNGACVLHMMTSHHKHEHLPVSHEEQRPSVPGPEMYKDAVSLFQEYLNQNRHSFSDVELKRVINKVTMHKRDIPMEVRPCEPNMYLYRAEQEVEVPVEYNEPWSRWWIRMKPTNGVVTKAIRHLFLMYVSDWKVPVMFKYTFPNVLYSLETTLDIAVWIHDDFDEEEWLLLESKGYNFKHCLGAVHGRIWTESGKLVASFNEGCLLRGKMKQKL